MKEEDVKHCCAVGAGVDGGDGGLVRKRWKLFWDFDGRVASPACYLRLQTRNIFKIVLNELTKQFKKMNSQKQFFLSMHFLKLF